MLNVCPLSACGVTTGVGADDPLFSDPFPSIGGAGVNLRVMNWNIGEGGPNGGLGGEWLDRIAELIRGEAADVVLLNEIRWFAPQYYGPGKP